MERRRIVDEPDLLLACVGVVLEIELYCRVCVVKMLSIVDVVERNERLGQYVKSGRIRFPQAVCNVQGIDEGGCPALHPVTQAMKLLVTWRMLEVSASCRLGSSARRSWPDVQKIHVKSKMKVSISDVLAVFDAHNIPHLSIECLSYLCE